MPTLVEEDDETMLWDCWMSPLVPLLGEPGVIVITPLLGEPGVIVITEFPELPSSTRVGDGATAGLHRSTDVGNSVGDGATAGLPRSTSVGNSVGNGAVAGFTVGASVVGGSVGGGFAPPAAFCGAVTVGGSRCSVGGAPPACSAAS